MTKEDINNISLSLHDKTLNDKLDHIIAESAQKEEVKISLDEKKPATSESADVYAQVSLEDHKADKNGQIARAVRYANRFGLKVGMTITEINSDSNGPCSEVD